MNSFPSVMRAWWRMCNYYDKIWGEHCCDHCPLDGNCGAIYDTNFDTDYSLIENAVTEWAQLHPITYMTWSEFIKQQTSSSTILDVLNESIPEELAIKLQIQPKETP